MKNGSLLLPFFFVLKFIFRPLKLWGNSLANHLYTELKRIARHGLNPRGISTLPI